MIGRVALVRALVALLGCWLLVGCGTPPAPLVSPRLRVVIWNIHHGAGLDERVDVRRIASELMALRPDVVLLQEVDVGCRRSGGVDIPSELGDALSMHAAFAENIPFQGGSYGNAILSRWPIEASHNLHYQMLREGEQRGLLTARMASPSGPLAVGCTHLDYRPDDSERLSNIRQLHEEVQRRRLVLVGGDFNDLPGRPVHAAVCARMADCWIESGGGESGASYPASGSTKRIDWLLRDREYGAVWRTVEAHVVATEASDHRPVLFVLERAR